jgi:hypothetical protein
MESLESDFLMDAPLMEPSMSLPLQHHGNHTDSMHLANGNHGSLDPLHDLSGGDEDYKEMLQILVPPTLPTSSCKPSYNQSMAALSSKTPLGVSVCCCSLQGNFHDVRGAACSLIA